MPVTEFALGLVAAALLGTGFVLQQDVAQLAPAAHFLRLRLVGDLLRRPRWLARSVHSAQAHLGSPDDWPIAGVAIALLALGVAEPGTRAFPSAPASRHRGPPRIGRGERPPACPEPPGTDSADIEIAHTQNPQEGRK